MREQPVHRDVLEQRADLPPQAVRFTQRATVLDATVREIAAHGYAAVSIAGIVRRAGVPRHAFYKHFSSKQEAVIAAYDLAAAFAIPRILDAFRGQPDWASGARAALGVYVAILDWDHAWSLTCLREVSSAGPIGVTARDTIRDPIVSELQASTPIPSAVGVVALLAALDAIAVHAMSTPGRPMRERAPALIQCVLAPIVGLPRPGESFEYPTSAEVCAATIAPSKVVEELDSKDAQRLLAVLIRDAQMRRDGPALWQVLMLMHQRRANGGAVPELLEYKVLDALDDAWFFGLLPR